MQVVFDSGSLAAGEGLELFDELQRSGEHPMRARGATSEGFTATVRAIDLTPVSLVELATSRVDIVRSTRMIRDLDPGLCSVILPLRGEVDLRYGHRATRLGPGDLALYGSSQPFAAGIAHDTTLLRAHLPLARLPVSATGLGHVMGVRLDGTRGLGAMLTLSLRRVLLDAESFRPSDAVNVGTVISDLMAALIAHELDDTGWRPDAARRRGLLATIESFIHDHLDDPGLSPTTIAAAQHISVGYLHRVFRSREETVAAYIRRRRLERARRDLEDPGLTTVPIHRIAARWGFSDHTSFTRAFRETYDVAPRDYRHCAASA